MEVKASGDDEDATREASITEFNAGDIVGKLMAFIAQLHSCSELVGAVLVTVFELFL